MPTTRAEYSKTTSHPLPERLAALSLGKLDDDEAGAIIEHLSMCDPCRALVGVGAEDSLVRLLRRANGAGTTVGGLEGRTSGVAVLTDSPPGYVVLEVLGEGGMGVVSKALQVHLSRLVALKQVRPDTLIGRDGVARFRREAEAVARLRHPNIVPIYDVGWQDDVPYYAMEYVEGGTLRQRLAAGPLAPKDAARLVETLSRAVQHAHDAGVVHRDLKPANILLAPDLDHPKIGDFGLAKLDNDSTRTRSGVLLGTPNYMSPEQAEGDSSRVGPPADVYALGAILYEALAGRPPFMAPSVLETLDQVRLVEPTPPRRVLGSIPRDLETILLKCLEKSPDRRYASALALADDLRRHLDGRPIAVRPSSSAERLAKWARRRPWQATSMALGGVILFGTLAGALAHNARLRDEILRTERVAEEAGAQRARAEGQYRSARGAIQKMLGRLDEPRFAGKPLGGELGIRRQLLEDALSFYEGAVRDDADGDVSARIDKVEALLEFANYQILLGKSDEAQRVLRRALALLDTLPAGGHDGPEIARVRVACLVKLGFALHGIGRHEEAIGTYRVAIEEIEGSRRGTLGDVDDLAWCHHNLGNSLMTVDRPVDAEAHLVRASEIRRALLASHPQHSELRARLAETMINLAQIHARLGKRERAEAEFADAAGSLGPIVRGRPDRGETALALGQLYLHWGKIALDARQFGLAIERFRTGLVLVEDVLREVPDWPEAKQRSGQLNAAIGLALGEAGRYREAAVMWDHAIARVDPEWGRDYRLSRLICLARDGDVAEALSGAEAMATDSSRIPSGLDLYNFACVAAVVASVEEARSPDRAEAAAVRAIAWLERARVLGTFRDRGMIETLDQDPDLASLRSRRGYQLFRLDAAFPLDPFVPGK